MLLTQPTFQRVLKRFLIKLKFQTSRLSLPSPSACSCAVIERKWWDGNLELIDVEKESYSHTNYSSLNSINQSPSPQLVTNIPSSPTT